ncbi:hypothetical protein D3C76_628620 [compost metagenome]
MTSRTPLLGFSSATTQHCPSGLTPRARISPSIPTKYRVIPEPSRQRASSSTPNPLAIPLKSRLSGTRLRTWLRCGSTSNAPLANSRVRGAGESITCVVTCRAAGPKPHAFTRSPTAMSKAPPDCRLTRNAADSTVTSSLGTDTHSCSGAALRRLRSDSGFQVDICWSTRATARASCWPSSSVSIPAPA